jgi:CheY-like chemotaxis protein
LPKKVLLVDDSVTSRLMHRIIVAKNTDYTVVCAQDGDQALELAYSEKPDLVLMDIMMPGTNGLEVCRRFREQKETSLVPIVMLTFRTGEGRYRRASPAGVQPI